MARTEARILTSIWEDAGFLALPPPARLLFLFLISQPDIDYSGVLPLRERRWAGTNGITVDQLRAQLDVLAEHRFVVVDEDAEELLVRSFVRNDGVYRQPNLLRSASRSLGSVRSVQIRSALAEEIQRAAAADDVPAGSRPVLDEILAKLPNPSPKGSPNPCGNPSADPSIGNPSPNPTPRARGKGEGSRYVQVVDPDVDSDSLRSSARSAKSKPRSETKGQRANRLTVAYSDRVQPSNFPAIAKIVGKFLGDFTDEQITKGLTGLADAQRPVTTDSLRIEITGSRPRAARHTPYRDGDRNNLDFGYPTGASA